MAVKDHKMVYKFIGDHKKANSADLFIEKEVWIRLPFDPLNNDG